MKRISFLSTLLLISVTIFAGNPIFEETNKKPVGKDTKSMASSVPGTSITVVCKGKCGSENCGAVYNTSDWTLRCTCTECTMHVTNNGPALDKSYQVKADATVIGPAFVEYIKKMHESDDYMITMYKCEFHEKAEVIFIEYMLDEYPDEVLSLAFVVSFDDSKAPPTTVIVDCFGSCDDPYTSCVEVFDMITQQISCSCGGTKCKMKVESVK